jgi:sporulation protein YtfJ
MEQHPIEGLMRTALENIKGMVDVSTVVGEPVENSGGIMMTPICKVSFGFVSGGSEFGGLEGGGGAGQAGQRPGFPFGGGSGAGVAITPIGFLVVQGESVRLVTSDSTVNLVERVADLTPTVIERLKQALGKKGGETGAAGAPANTPPEEF